MEDKINVYCQSCDNEDYETKEVLIEAGWMIEEYIQLCPLCNAG